MAAGRRCQSPLRRWPARTTAIACRSPGRRPIRSMGPEMLMEAMTRPVRSRIGAETLATPGSRSASRSPLLFAALALSLLLLGTAAVPPSAVPRPRAAMLLADWRVELAAAGLSALCAAAVLLLLASPGS